MLTQRQRKALVQLRGRQGRRKADVFLVEGVRCCTEALRLRPSWLVLTVLSHSLAASDPGAEFRRLSEGVPGTDLCVVPDGEFARLSDTQSPQGVLCLLRRPGPGLPEAVVDPFVLVLDRIREPGNLGVILRTAWAVGLRQVWLTEGCADPFAPKVVRAAMGAHFALDLISAADLRRVREGLAVRGVSPLYLTVPRGGLSCFEEGFHLGGSALVIGNEADGIVDLDLGPHVGIPMPGGAESLNASQAATVLLLDAVRRGILRTPYSAEGKANPSGNAK
ncbi:MAG: RNA methyltransferase [Lentisphaeria bacterium]|nr:RNA methyltransferase [Lentisphaeria bacterium]